MLRNNFESFMQAMYYFDGFTFFVKYNIETQTADFTERNAIGAGHIDVNRGKSVLIKDDVPGLKEAQTKLLEIIREAIRSR